MNPNLNEFLSYQDMDDYSPIRTDFAVVRGYRLSQTSDQDAPDWQREGWLLRSAMVQAANADAARDTFDCNYIQMIPGWNGDDFEFGLSSEIDGIEAESLYVEREHPLTGELIVELRQDFIIYHALDRREDAGCVDYRHPLDDVPVAKIRMEEWWPFKPTPLVKIHSDYLRDYLAARHSALVICQVSDRFANAASPKELGVTQAERHLVEPGLWLQIDVYEHRGLFCARSTLWRNLVVEPYARPKPQRGPWHYSHGSDEESTAQFIVDGSGTLSALGDVSQPYLYFRREVLSRFLTTAGYSVWFHMRHWGAAVHPGEKSVDVGINEEGYVTAFAPDLRKLAPRDQTYWSSYTTRAIGGVCAELWQTRMQLDPPDSPGVCELIENAMTALDAAFSGRWASALFRPKRPDNSELAKLTIGPLHDRHEDLFPLANTLCQLTMERLQISSLRTPLDSAGIQYHKEKDKQLNLLDLLCLKLLKLSADETALITGPLRGLNELRRADAHLGRADMEKAFAWLGSSQVPQSAIRAWDAVVDATAGALHRMAACLG